MDLRAKIRECSEDLAFMTLFVHAVCIVVFFNDPDTYTEISGYVKHYSNASLLTIILLYGYSETWTYVGKRSLMCLGLLWVLNCYFMHFSVVDIDYARLYFYLIFITYLGTIFYSLCHHLLFYSLPR